jgi:O-antigen ligase
MIHWGTIGLLLILAFALNLPLGAWRKSQRKFSPAWFLGIHASIPLLFAARIEFDLSYWVIPPEIVLALAGQLAGSRLRGSSRSAFEPVAKARVRPDS